MFAKLPEASLNSEWNVEDVGTVWVAIGLRWPAHGADFFSEFDCNA